MQHSTIKSNELQQIMSYCYGTEHYYKIPAYSFKYTDGIKTFCENADAYWLLDIVESVCRTHKEIHNDFILIELSVNKYNQATITFEYANNTFYKQQISFTDCPEGTWRFYFDNNVFFWNGEY